MDRRIFFAGIRPMFPRGLSRDQVAGIEKLVDEYARRQWRDLRHLAYILATAHHETAMRMQPVRETLADSDAEAIRILDRAFAAGKLPWVSKPYWRPDADGLSWLGRSIPQLTHKANYEKADKALKLGGALVRDPAKAMEWPIALGITFDGMGEGWFAGDGKGRHNLTRYFSAKVNDPIGARRIINGTDKAAEIAKLHRDYLEALTAAGA